MDIHAWIGAEHAFLCKLVEKTVEAAAEKAVRRDPYARKEGGGVWNRSRAPHCYGFEYEQHFGKPISILTVSKEHEKLWRQSSWWPNVPPVEHFYSDHFEFQNQCMDLLYDRALEKEREELEDRKRRRKAYDLAYNEVRRKRRRSERRNLNRKLNRSICH